jgi:hypothetical protein
MPRNEAVEEPEYPVPCHKGSLISPVRRRCARGRGHAAHLMWVLDGAHRLHRAYGNPDRSDASNCHKRLDVQFSHGPTDPALARNIPLSDPA